MRDNVVILDKHNAPVKVRFSDGAVQTGLVFLRQGQRVLEMLCDGKPFFALSTKSGLLLVNKEQVISIQILDKESYETEKELFPPFDADGLEFKSW